MAKKKNDGCAVLAMVAFVAFFVGRCSGDGTGAAGRSPADPAPFAEIAIETDPVESGAAAPDDLPAPEPQRFYAPQPERPSRSGTSFRNCSEARAMGAAPVMRGDPGYAPRLDRDADGVGCE